MNKPNELKTYTFIDGDFSMDINVSLEEHNVYMKQTEIAKLLGIGQSTVSKIIKKMDFSKWDIYSKNEQIGIFLNGKEVNYYGLEIIKEIGQKYNSERIQKLEEWLEQIIVENSQEVVDDNFEIVRYNQDNINIPVRYDKATNQPWLTQKEISILYGTTKQDVNYHINNILEDRELNKNSVVKDYFTTGIDGKTYKINHIIFNSFHITNTAFKTSEATLLRRCY